MTGWLTCPPACLLLLACRRHAPQLLATASEIKHSCRSLAAVLRDNSPVAPALAQLARLEAAFLALQQAADSPASAPGPAATRGAEQAQREGAGDAAAGSADVAQDSLALHLALSMLYTCCTRVRYTSCSAACFAVTSSEGVEPPPAAAAPALRQQVARGDEPPDSF